MDSNLDNKSKQYQSYLLRIWKDDDRGEWRALLLTIPTQERRHFSSLNALFEFLNEQQISPDSLVSATSKTHLSPQLS